MTHAKRSHRKKERGQALMEFALLAPLLVILIFGFVDTARLYNAWVTVQGAAREGARYGVTGRGDCPTATDNRTVCIKYWASQRAKSLTNSSTGLSVTVRSWDYPAYADPANEGDPGQQCDALAVRDVRARSAAPLVVVVEGGQIVVHERECVHELDGGRGRERRLHGAARALGDGEAEDRPDALAPGIERVPHRLLEPLQVRRELERRQVLLDRLAQLVRRPHRRAPARGSAPTRSPSRSPRAR